MPAAYRACAESVVPEMCGVIASCGMVRHGWSGGGRLREPHVAGVPGELAGTQRVDHVVAHHDLGPRGVDDVRAATHRVDQVGVEHVVRLRMKRRVDVDDVDRAHQRLHIRVVREVQFLLQFLGQAPGVEVVEVDVERGEAAQHRLTDTAGRDDADVEALEVVGALDAVGDVPAAVDHPLMRRQVQ